VFAYPPDFAVIFEASALSLLFSFREDSHFMIAAEKLLFLSWMNLPMAGMSTDNDCKRWNETTPFEEEPHSSWIPMMKMVYEIFSRKIFSMITESLVLC
jgi:hypothetical protein